MRMITSLILIAALAYLCGVRVHPENIPSKPAAILTVREQDNLLIKWGILKGQKKGTMRNPLVVPVQESKPRTSSVSSKAPASSSSGPVTAKNIAQKATDLARKATGSSQY